MTVEKLQEYIIKNILTIKDKKILNFICTLIKKDKK